jgi:hypothetical protein
MQISTAHFFSKFQLLSLPRRTWKFQEYFEVFQRNFYEKSQFAENSSLGDFFARKMLRRIILRREVLRSHDSSPENSPLIIFLLERKILRLEDSSLGIFFARSFLRQIIFCSKKTLEAENSLLDDSSLGKFFARELPIFFR